MGSSLQNHPALLESEAELSFEDLASRQGVKPVAAFEDLLGSPATEDESSEEFEIMLRAWRNEFRAASEPIRSKSPKVQKRVKDGYATSNRCSIVD